MKLNQRGLKRLAIYFFYDADGIVDDYVICMLEEMKRYCSQVLVVCNGILTSEGRKKLEAETSLILVRENKGFDVWAYKEAMEYFGWDHLQELDELILMNSTIIGPIYPFDSMFNEMDSRDVDFWGITVHSKLGFDPFGKITYGYLPTHIQSHFIAVRSHMLKSIEFKQYWDKRPLISTYEDAICSHEAIFTRQFEEKGFNWQVYVDTSDLEKYTANPIMFVPLELVKNRRCPIIKRRNFFQDLHNFLSMSVGNASLDLYDYVKDHTSYDVNMIWDNILRTQNMADIKNCLQLNYIVPSWGLKNSTRPAAPRKVAMVMHLYFMDLVGYCFNYASSMPGDCDVYITTDTAEKKEELLKTFKKLNCNKLQVLVIENRGRDVSALLVGCCEFILGYDVVCFVHDKKAGQLDWDIKGDSFSYQCFENLLKNSTFVENVIGLFDENPRLGMLVPPPPGFADYYFTFGNSWGQNYPVTHALIDKLGIKVPISPDKEPIAPLGTMFWFRPAALKQLFERGWKYSDFPKEPNPQDGTLLHAIERSYPFVAQQAGYYSAWVLADTFARLHINDMNFMLGEINKTAFQLYGLNTHYGLLSTMQATLAGNENAKTTDRALKALLILRLKRATPTSVWNFMKKIYHFVRRS
jgi:lipopolysaccharide biosynthesis protein